MNRGRHRIALALLAVAAVSLLSTGAAKARQQEEGINATVIVYDGREQVGRPSGVTFRVQDADGNEVGSGTSDEEGEAFVALPGPGTYEATIDPSTLPDGVVLPDPEDATLHFEMHPGQVRPILFPLEVEAPEEEQGVNAFVFIDGERERVSGVTIVVEDADGNEVGSATSENGEAFVPLEPGQYVVAIDLDTLPEGFVLRPESDDSTAVELGPGDTVLPVVFGLVPGEATSTEDEDEDEADASVDEEDEDDGGGLLLWVGITALVLGGGVVGWMVARRRTRPGPPTSF